MSSKCEIVEVSGDYDKIIAMQKWPINLRRLLIFTGIFILILMVVEFNARLEELNRLTEERDIVRAEATRVMQTQIILLTDVAYAGADQAVEDWARSDGHFIQEGDRPVVPVGIPGVPLIEESTPTPTPPPLPAWQAWWKLFFEE
jgi:hypothetical protein